MNSVGSCDELVDAARGPIVWKRVAESLRG